MHIASSVLSNTKKAKACSQWCALPANMVMLGLHLGTKELVQIVSNIIY